MELFLQFHALKTQQQSQLFCSCWKLSVLLFNELIDMFLFAVSPSFRLNGLRITGPRLCFFIRWISCKGRSQTRYVGKNIHTFVLTDYKNNRLQNKLIFARHTNIRIVPSCMHLLSWRRHCFACVFARLRQNNTVKV